MLCAKQSMLRESTGIPSLEWSANRKEERDRETERQRERQTETERDRQRQTERQRERCLESVRYVLQLGLSVSVNSGKSLLNVTE